MEFLSLTMGKAFDTSVMILIVGLVRLAVEIAKLFVLSDIHFIRFMGPMDRTEGSGIGAPIPLVAGATDGKLRAG
jgi:hypothetical protein